jgi:phospholipid transport system transporter-binding protein
VSTVALPVAVTMHNASTALRSVQAALAQGGDLVLDAAALAELDTAAVALLLQARRLANAKGVAFRLQAAPPKLTALAQLYGVESLLGST